MPGLVKTIKIVRPPLEIVGGMVLMVRSPRSEHSVTVMVNPAAEDYQAHPVDEPEMQIREASAWTFTEETQEFFFDLKGTYIHMVNIGSETYEVRLLNIGKINQDGPGFPTYEFLVTQQ